MNIQEYLLTLNVPPLLEEAMVDCLLSIESDGFSSLIVNAHGSDHQHLSLAEQVSGRQKQVRFQMYVSEQQLSELIELLKKNFSGGNIHYWVMPVLQSGSI